MIEFEGLSFNNLNDLYELGIMYYYGLKVRKDRARAVQIFKNLAKQSHIKAMAMLKQIRAIRSYEGQKRYRLHQ